MKQTSGRPSKTIPWVKEGPLSIPIKDQKVYTCTIDKSKRPSAISTAKEGQKCIVILLEDEPMQDDEKIMETLIEILTSDDPEVQKIVEETLKMSEQEMTDFMHSEKSYQVNTLPDEQNNPDNEQTISKSTQKRITTNNRNTK